MRIALVSSLMGIVWCGITTHAQPGPQDYPNKSIRLLVGNAPGDCGAAPNVVNVSARLYFAMPSAISARR